MSENTYKIFHGDCLEVLKDLESNSIDSVVSDPPYGLSKEPKIEEVLTKWLAGEEYDHGHGGFMGKSWDSFVPHPDIWREVYRVLKPGGHALIFAGTRTQDLMTISLRLAGFEVRDVIEWLYFSGFPKSHDVGKAFDKRNGRNYPDDDFRAYLKERAKESGLTGAQVDLELGSNGMWGHYTGRSQPAFPTVEVWGQLKSLLSLDDRYDEIIHRTEAEREKIGRTKGAQAESTGRYGAWGNDNGNGISEYDITAPATDLAKQWDGWGTALKPAHEPIIVVRKPLIDEDTGRKLTVADCVEKYGTGAVNIDGSRISYSADKPKETSNQNIRNGSYKSDNSDRDRDTVYTPADNGRFPANIVTVDDDAFYSKYSDVTPNITPQELSKKASKSDRNSDWKGDEIDLEPRLIERESPLAAAENRTTSRVNYHPTVKPLDLMAWLVRLVTPPEGTVLDPFAGSGSTLAAAKREGFGFVGVELTDEYIPIIEARTGETVTEKAEEEPKEEALV